MQSESGASQNSVFLAGPVTACELEAPPPYCLSEVSRHAITHTITRPDSAARDGQHRCTTFQPTSHILMRFRVSEGGDTADTLVLGSIDLRRGLHSITHTVEPLKHGARGRSSCAPLSNLYHED